MHFVLVSEANPNLVLDIAGASKEKGAHLIVWEHNGGENQLFHLSEKGFITSKHSGLVIDIQKGVHEGHHIIQWESHGQANQLWRLAKDGTIHLEGHDLVLTVEGGLHKGHKLIAAKNHGGLEQKWRVVTKY